MPDDKKPRQEPRDEAEILKDVASQLSEHANNFLIATSMGGRFLWITSDTTWAMGAVDRLNNSLQAADRDVPLPGDKNEDAS